ncbi:MAG: UDP-N-acetylmuramoyl-tripeptide--D-alanyl-D-alanine ligase, partial [Anaerolineae bacterium]
LKQTRLPNGVMMLDDAYNTNPVGSASALEVLKLNQNGRRVLITPGMVELGPLHEEENEKLGQRAAAACTDIVLVGVEQTKPIQRGVKNAGFDETHLHVFETVTEAIQWYQAELKAGDAVLILNDLPDNYM